MVVILNKNLIKILLNLLIMLHFSSQQQQQSSYIDIDLTESGYLTDKTGLINLNLSEIFLNKTRFNLTHHNLNKYSIGFQLNNSTNQQCSNSIVCEIIDTNNTHSINDIGTRIDHIKYESTNKTFEFLIKSTNNKCESTILFYCDESSTNISLKNDDSKNCVYKFYWPSNRICNLSSVPQSTTKIVLSSISTTQPQSTTTTILPILNSNNRIPSFVIVFLILMILIIILLLFNCFVINHNPEKVNQFFSSYSKLKAQLAKINWFGTMTKIRRRNRNRFRHNMRTIKYKRINNLDRLDNDDDGTNFLESDEAEITNLFDDSDQDSFVNSKSNKLNGSQSTKGTSKLRIQKDTGSFETTFSSQNDFLLDRSSGTIDGITSLDNTLFTRQDSSNNMMLNIDSDDNLIEG